MREREREMRMREKVCARERVSVECVRERVGGGGMKKELLLFQWVIEMEIDFLLCERMCACVRVCACVHVRESKKVREKGKR